MVYYGYSSLCAIIILAVGYSCSDIDAECGPQKAPEPFRSEPKKAVQRAKDEGALNLVIVSIDTLRRDHLGVYGYAKETSANIDRLAKESVVFDTAITVHTNTAPAHASILTGRYPGSHGLRRNGMKLKEGIPTLATLLKQKGYATGGFVSGWTMKKRTLLGRDFDVYDDKFSTGNRKGPKTWKEAREWLRAQAKDRTPFFLFLHLFDPHFTYEPPESFSRRFLENQEKFSTPEKQRGLPGLKERLKLTLQQEQEYVARYDGEILYADSVVKKLIRELKRLRVLRTTTIVFLSDHGETLFERDWVADHGGRVYDEQVRIPLMIRFHDKWKAGTRVSEQVSHVDVLPTVLDILDIETSIDTAGLSLIPLIANRESEKYQRPAFSHGRPEPKRVPEIHARLVKKGLISSIRYPTVKLIEYPMEKGRWHRQLFDLIKDPEEKNDIALKKPKLAQQLHEQLEKWRIQTGVSRHAEVPQLSNTVKKALRALGYVD